MMRRGVRSEGFSQVGKVCRCAGVQSPGDGGQDTPGRVVRGKMGHFLDFSAFDPI